MNMMDLILELFGKPLPADILAMEVARLKDEMSACNTSAPTTIPTGKDTITDNMITEPNFVTFELFSVIPTL